MKVKPDKDGYLKAALYSRGGIIRHTKVHVLVLEAFKGRRPEGMVSRHLDGDKSNNSDRNLKWGTISENSVDRINHGRNRLSVPGDLHPAASLTASQIEHILYLRSRGVPRAEVAEQFGIHRNYVTTLCRFNGRAPAREKRRTTNG